MGATVCLGDAFVMYVCARGDGRRRWYPGGGRARETAREYTVVGAL